MDILKIRKKARDAKSAEAAEAAGAAEAATTREDAGLVAEPAATEPVTSMEDEVAPPDRGSLVEDLLPGESLESADELDPDWTSIPEAPPPETVGTQAVARDAEPVEPAASFDNAGVSSARVPYEDEHESDEDGAEPVLLSEEELEAKFARSRRELSR